MSFDAYDNTMNFYAQTENIPTITLYSDGQTTTYKPQSMREYELWEASKEANRHSYMSFAISGYFLAVILALIIGCYILNFFMCSNRNLINRRFSYIFFGWLILFFYLFYQSNESQRKFIEIDQEYQKVRGNNLPKFR